MAILSQEMVSAMRVHRYSSEGHSLLEFPEMYKYFAEKLPCRLSPNAVTLTGLFSSFTPCILAIYQSCIGNEEGFRTMSYFCVFGFLMWLVCDNMDGILARLRGCCGPFGEILDHGGDAVGVLFTSVTIISCFNFQGKPLSTFAFVLSDVAANYLSEPYTVYILGKFYTESIDFSEIVLLCMVIAWFTGSYGSNIWIYEIIPGTGFQVRYIFYMLKAYIFTMLIVGKFTTFFKSADANKKQRNDHIRPLIPLLVVLISAFVAYISSSEEFLQQNVIQLTLCFGFSIAKLHIELIVTHIVKSGIIVLKMSLILPVSLALGIAFSGEPSMEMRLTNFFLVAIVFDAVVYFIRLLYEVYHAMDVRLLVLDYNDNIAVPKK